MKEIILADLYICGQNSNSNENIIIAKRSNTIPDNIWYDMNIMITFICHNHLHQEQIDVLRLSLEVSIKTILIAF